MTGDEFSKLSLKSKSLVSRQRMQWMIPQSRLNQQCPFLEKEYPYYTTDFSTLHYFTKDLEFKWKLTLERRGDNVVVDLCSCNDDDKSVRKEVKNILVNWSASISNSESSKNESLKTLELEHFNDFSESFTMCSIDEFELFVVDGGFFFDIIFELEYIQQPRKKLSVLQQARRFSSSISDLTSLYNRVSR